MDELNFIGSVKLDLNFYSENKSNEFQDKISNLFNDKITYDINQLFNSVAKHTIRKYDVIVLDIGEIEYNQLNNDLPSKIITALSDKLFFNSGNLITNLQEDINYKYYYESLEQFIKTGQIPYNRAKNDNNINELLNIVLIHNSDQFIKLLFNVGEKESVRKRMAYQFEISSTLKIINALEPQKFDTIKSYLSGMKNIQHKEKIVQAQAHEFERANLLFVLTYLLSKRGSVFNTMSFIRSQIKQMAGHYNITYNDLLLLMFQSAKKVIVSGSDIKIVDFIRTIFIEDYLSKEERKAINSNEEIEQLIEEPSKLKKLLLHNSIIYYLENGIWPEKYSYIELSEIQQEFEKIVRHEKGIVEKILKPNLILHRAKNVVSISTKDTYELLLKNINYNSYNFVIAILQLPIEKESKGLSNFEILKEAILYSIIKNKPQVTNNKNISIEIMDYLKQKSNFDFTLFLNDIKNLETQVISTSLINEFIDFVLANKNNVSENLKKEKNITKRERQDIITVLWNKFKLEYYAYPNTITTKKFRTFFNCIKDSLTKKEFINQAIEVFNKEKVNIKKVNGIDTFKKNDILSEIETTLTKYDYKYKHSLILIKEFIKVGKLPWWFKNDGIEQLKSIAKQVFIKEDEKWLVDIFRSSHDKKNIVSALKKLFTEQEFYNKFIFGANYNSTNFNREIKFITNEITDNVKIDLEYLSILFYANEKHEILVSNLKKAISNSANKSFYWDFIRNIANSNKQAIYSKFLPWLIQNLLEIDLLNANQQFIIPSDNSSNFENDLKFSLQNEKANTKSIYQRKTLFFEFINEVNINSLKAEALLDEVLIKKNEVSREASDYRLFLINSLKNEKIKSNIFSNTSLSGIQRFLYSLFTHKYSVLLPYINDLGILIEELNLFDNKQKTSSWLYLNTASFLIENEHNQINLANYIDYIFKSIKKHNNRISKRKIITTISNIYSINKLKTFLPFISKEIERIDKRKKEKKKKVNEKNEEEKKDLNDYIFVDNVGIVILWPFFEPLFNMFNLLIDGKFSSISNTEQAILLLHYIATGREDFIEHELTFAKILCNFPRNYPVIKNEMFLDAEIEILKNLKKTAIDRWKAIGETSIEGLRESFLKRQGKIIINESNEIVLFAEKKSYDMLIDRLPWSIATIRLPWLEKHIIVNWR